MQIQRAFWGKRVFALVALKGTQHCFSVKCRLASFSPNERRKTEKKSMRMGSCFGALDLSHMCQLQLAFFLLRSIMEFFCVLHANTLTNSKLPLLFFFFFICLLAKQFSLPFWRFDPFPHYFCSLFFSPYILTRQQQKALLLLLLLCVCVCVLFLFPFVLSEFALDSLAGSLRRQNRLKKKRTYIYIHTLVLFFFFGERSSCCLS